jgi:nucleoside-diphosphate-sugar epimerase
MNNLIIGYGYCGYFLAKKLINLNQNVVAVCRSNKKEYALEGLELIHENIKQSLTIDSPIDTLYYLIPPPGVGDKDTNLESFIENNQIECKTIVYFGSSGIYGNHQGNHVDENSPCFIKTDRQKRRLDAEKKWRQYAKQHTDNCVLLRIAGIYGPNRIPLKNAKIQTPVIDKNHAPLVNYIFINDLINAALLLAKHVTGVEMFNIADGKPSPMGQMQQSIAKHRGYEKAKEASFNHVYYNASSMKREFLNSSKKLNITKLLNTLGNDFTPTSMDEGLKLSLEYLL